MTLDEQIDALARVPIFAGLSRRSLKRIAQASSEVDVRAGQVLIEPRAKGSGLFVLLGGTVEVEMRGRESTELGPGEFFGELALLTPDAVRTARVRAKTPVRCLTITHDEFRKLLAAEPKVALAILETVAARLAALL